VTALAIPQAGWLKASVEQVMGSMANARLGELAIVARIDDKGRKGPVHSDGDGSSSLGISERGPAAPVLVRL